MFEINILKKWGLTFFLLGTLCAALFPLEIPAAPPATKGNLIGVVYLKDLNSPLPDAVIKIRSVKEGTEIQSEPTDKNGSYKLQGIDEGQYILSVSTKKADYNLEVLIQIKGGETSKLSIILKEGEAKR